MKLDMSHPKPYWQHKKYESEKYTPMPAIIIGAIILGLIIAAMAA